MVEFIWLSWCVYDFNSLAKKTLKLFVLSFLALSLPSMDWNFSLVEATARSMPWNCVKHVAEMQRHRRCSNWSSFTVLPSAFRFLAGGHRTSFSEPDSGKMSSFASGMAVQSWMMAQKNRSWVSRYMLWWCWNNDSDDSWRKTFTALIRFPKIGIFAK